MLVILSGYLGGRIDKSEKSKLVVVVGTGPAGDSTAEVFGFVIGWYKSVVGLVEFGGHDSILSSARSVS